MAKLLEITGKAISGEWGQDDDTGTGVPVLRTTNFTNEGFVNYKNVVTRSISKKNIEEKYLRHGDIIIEKSGGSDKQPVGRVIFFEGEENKYLFNNFTGLLRVQNPEEWLPKYVFYALYAYYRNGGTRAFENRTTGLHNLQVDNYVKSVDIPKLSYLRQQHICETLDHVRDAVAYREQQLSKLDELIKARFVEMFGDPVNNPLHWKKVKLSELADIKIGPFGSLLHKEDYVTGGHPLVNPSHIIDGKIIVDNDLTLTDEKYSELVSYHLKKDDIVLGRRGEMGRCAVVDREGLLCGTGSLLLRPTGVVTADYIQKIISFPTFKKTIEDMAVGQTMPNLNVPIVSNFMIILPPLSVQKEYYAFVAEVDKSKADVQKALDQTQLLFDSLMQQYFG